jgi:hypothetical protein
MITCRGISTSSESFSPFTPPVTTNKEDKSYYTFIIHKTNLEPDWKRNIATRRRQAPTFISFDHGSHFHILYSSASARENPARQRTRITLYLNAKSEGTAEKNYHEYQN